MATPVFQEQELEAFTWMQGRVVDLFLRHNTERFANTFGERDQTEEKTEDSILERYRNLAVLFYLKEELFEQILPGIKRRLSFEAPRTTLVEELPARGRIDWQRTARESWNERPGEFPLEVHTRQRRRHFATPENLLTVITILEYRAGVQELLDNEASLNSLQALIHPLNDIVDLCTRELAFLQFAGLVRECEDIIGGYSTVTTDELEGQVAENLLPGKNSAYSELLNWRQKFANLRLLSRFFSEELQNTLGADPNRDNYLYQLWLFYELGDYLQGAGRLIDWNHQEMWLRFSWGDPGNEVEYRLQHDQGIADIPNYWKNAPGVRPDFYIQRTDRQEIKNEGNLIWHEPGFVLDAKYYKPSDSAKAPSSPVKRMIADLQLTGERNGFLLFAFQDKHPVAKDKPDSTDIREEKLIALARQSSKKYQVAPKAKLVQHTQPDIDVGVWCFKPKITGDEKYLEPFLVELLNEVNKTLNKTRFEIRCRGLFLDSLSTNARGEMVSAALLQNRAGTAFGEGELEKLLLCPKPHVAPWRVDIVHLERDCLNSNLCHIREQLLAKKPQRIVNFEDIREAIRSSGTGEESEETLVKVATQQVLAVTQRFADLIKPNIEHYQQWILDNLEIGDSFNTTQLLTDSQRKTLALGRFLWEQIDNIKADNFAGPTLLFTGVLEEVTRITIYQIVPYLGDNRGRPLMQTLGTLGNCKGWGGNNWRILERSIMQGGHWEEKMPDGQTFPFSKWIDIMSLIAEIRNKAAHEADVDRATLRKFKTNFFGSTMSGLGAFNGLLLAWRT